MSRSKLPVEPKYIIFVLHTKYGRTQKKLADLFEISQSTVSNYIKEVRYEMRIKGLSYELERAYQFINEHMGLLTEGNQEYLDEGEYRELDE